MKSHDPVLDTNDQLLDLAKARRSGAISKSASNARVQELRALFFAAIDRRLGAGTSERVHNEVADDIEAQGLDLVIKKALES
jgi:hypothetical protein